MRNSTWGIIVLGLAVLVSSCGFANSDSSPRPTPRADVPPVMRWDHRPEAAMWTSDALVAVKSHGAVLMDTVPEDIAAFCPSYDTASRRDRAAFWVGLMSALAKHESTWRPKASGGNGAWIGLTQIDPRTAQGYDCRAQSVAELKNGSANLSCAVRIAAVQVGKDEMLVSKNGNWRGMARDWAPFRSAAKRADMANWTSKQAYCQPR